MISVNDLSGPMQPIVTSGARSKITTASDRVPRRLAALVHPFFLAGTFAPFFRAFERPMAIACFRLLAFPDLPLFCVPAFVFSTAFFTSFFAAAPYFAIAFSFPGELFGFASFTRNSLMHRK